MSEKIKQTGQFEDLFGGKLSKNEIVDLLNDFGVRGLKEDPEHSEFFILGDVHIQKLKHIGKVIFKDKKGRATKKAKPIKVRIEELLGLREEVWEINE